MYVYTHTAYTLYPPCIAIIAHAGDGGKTEEEKRSLRFSPPESVLRFFLNSGLLKGLLGAP